MPIPFYPTAKACLYLYLADNQPHSQPCIVLYAAGGQMDTGDDLIEKEFRTHRQLLWAIFTPGKNLQGANSAAGLFFFWQKNYFWQEEIYFIMLANESTVRKYMWALSRWFQDFLIDTSQWTYLFRWDLTGLHRWLQLHSMS